MQEKEQKISPVKQRILQHADTLGISRRAFYERIGVSRGTLESRTGITEDIMAKFIAAFPDVSVEWLVTGRGEKFDSRNADAAILDHKQTRRKETFSSPQNNLPMASDVRGRYDSGNDIVIPIVDITAIAESYRPDYTAQNDAIKLPPALLHKGTHNCIRIQGQSMAPTLQDGSYVISRLLEPAGWMEIKEDYIYVISTRKGETFIRRAVNRLANNGSLICASDNPDKTTYPDINLKGEDIESVWQVEWYLSSGMPNIHAAYYCKLQEMEMQIEDISSFIYKQFGKKIKGVKNSDKTT